MILLGMLSTTRSKPRSTVAELRSSSVSHGPLALGIDFSGLMLHIIPSYHGPQASGVLYHTLHIVPLVRYSGPALGQTVEGIYFHDSPLFPLKRCRKHTVGASRINSYHPGSSQRKYHRPLLHLNIRLLVVDAYILQQACIQDSFSPQGQPVEEAPIPQFELPTTLLFRFFASASLLGHCWGFTLQSYGLPTKDF